MKNFVSTRTRLRGHSGSMNHETTNVNQRPESRRVLWLTGAAVVFVIATLLILSLSGRSKLATAVAQLRSQGLPTNMAELNSYYAIPSGVQDTTAEWQAAIKAADTAQKMPAIAALPLIGRGPMPGPPRELPRH